MRASNMETSTINPISSNPSSHFSTAAQARPSESSAMQDAFETTCPVSRNIALAWLGSRLGVYHCSPESPSSTYSLSTANTTSLPLTPFTREHAGEHHTGRPHRQGHKHGPRRRRERALVEAKLVLDDSPARPLRRRAAAVLADAPGLDYRARKRRRRRRG